MSDVAKCMENYTINKINYYFPQNCISWENDLNRILDCGWIVIVIGKNCGSFSKCDDPMSHYEHRYVLYLAGMSRYEDETLSQS